MFIFLCVHSHFYDRAELLVRVFFLSVLKILTLRCEFLSAHVSQIIFFDVNWYQLIIAGELPKIIVAVLNNILNARANQTVLQNWSIHAFLTWLIAKSERARKMFVFWPSYKRSTSAVFNFFLSLFSWVKIIVAVHVHVILLSILSFEGQPTQFAASRKCCTREIRKTNFLIMCVSRWKVK